MTHKVNSVEEGRKRLVESLNNGTALQKFKQMLMNLRVEEKVAHELCYGNPGAILPMAKHKIEIKSLITGIDKF